MDKYIRVKNCNCISDATIEIVEKSLNIKYGSNGTGKSTISEAIYAQANNETDRLKDFKPYGSNDNSQPTVDNPYFHVVKVFNEDYVNSYLFQGDEFLDDSFQVFLKSDKCDSLAAQIERMLEELQDLINNIDAIHNLRTFLPQYTAAVKASDGTVSRRGGVAEFVNGNGGGFNHYSELKAYKPFYSRDLPSVAKWAKWRNDGIKQMCGNDCPFCTNILPSSIRSQNEIISKVFKNSALSVANAVLEYVQQAVDQGYILPDAVDVLESYIGDNSCEILLEYKVTPGVDWNGKFHENVFRSWMDFVKAWSLENDRYEVTMETVGAGFAYAQLDDEKLPQKVIIEELNKVENEELRRGYDLGVVNQRGVHFIDPEGKPELELAADYEMRADLAEKKGYSRFAELLRGIAEQYRREASRNIRRARREVEE